MDGNVTVFRILGLIIGPLLAILLGYWQVRATRGLARSHEKREADSESEAMKAGTTRRILLQALLSYPYAFYVLIVTLSNPEPVTYSSVFMISLSIGIIILGALLNTITFTIASSTNLFKLILSNIEKSMQVDQRLRDAIADFSWYTKPEKPKSEKAKKKVRRR